MPVAGVRSLMEALLQDIRYALRQLARSPVFLATALLCIAIGVGANTTIFSVFNALLLRPVPGIQAVHELVEVGRDVGAAADSLPYPTWRDLQESAETVEIALYKSEAIAVSSGAEPEVVLGDIVTGNYFRVLGVAAAEGRFFAPGETSVADPQSVVVISHELFQRRFGADRAIVGSQIHVNSRSMTVIGVTSPGFRGHTPVLPVDIWVPLGLAVPGLPTQRQLSGEQNQFLVGVGRLASGRSAAEASAELNGLMAAMVSDRPFLEDTGVAVLPLENLPGFAHTVVQLFVSVLMVVVGLVLLIACINVAGMLMVRSSGRSREMAIRQALGAGRGRILRQLLTETILLFLIGGGLGVLASVWATRALTAFEPPSPRPFVVTFDLGLDERVLLFSLVLTFVTALIFGLGPALRTSWTSLVPSLKEARPGRSLRRSRLRSVLIAGQMAMTLLLLVGAGLFLRSLAKAQAIDPGFDPAGVEVVSFDLQLHGYAEDAGGPFYARLREAVAATPGVSAAGLTRLLPLGFPSTTSFGGVNVEGVAPPAGQSSYAAPLNIVSPGYFKALGLPLIAGRDFSASDESGQSGVAIINQRMADHFFPGGAVGRSFIEGSVDSGNHYRIVGVAGDSKYATLGEESRFFYYRPLAQSYTSAMSLLVRGPDGVAPPTAAVRSVVNRLDSSLPFLDVLGLSDYVAITYLPQRVAGIVAGLLGSVGLLLGAVGIAGVATFMAQQRFQEMGIRMALGAGQEQLTRLFVRQGMVAPLVGAGAGLLAAGAATHLLSSLLFGIDPLDPLTIGAVSVLLLGVALAANWLPVRAAVRRDPLSVLKYE